MITAVLLVAIFFITSWRLLGLFLIAIFGLVLLARLSIKYCFKKLKIPTLMIAIMFLLQVFFMPLGDVIFEIAFIQVTSEAVLSGVLTFSRLIIIIISILVLTTTTTSQELTLALESFLKPAVKLGFKTGALLLAFRMIGRFIPSISREANKILKAQAARGLDIKGANIWMKMRLLGALLLPVFVVSIKRADELSDSMAVRGYVINGKRTSYRTLRKD